MIPALLNWKAEKASQKVFKEGQLFSLVWLVRKGGYSFQECSWKKVAKQMGRFGNKRSKVWKIEYSSWPTEKTEQNVSCLFPQSPTHRAHENIKRHDVHSAVFWRVKCNMYDLLSVRFCGWKLTHGLSSQQSPPTFSGLFSSVLKAEGRSVLPCLVTVITVVSVATLMMLLAPSPLSSFPLLPCLHPSLDQFSSVAQLCPTPHGLQHARPPCPSPTLRVYSNSCPSSLWCHPTTSSSVAPFSSCPQSFPASGSFPMSQLFALGGQSTGASALASSLQRTPRTDLL